MLRFQRGDFPWVFGNTCLAPHELRVWVFFFISWESPCGQETKKKKELWLFPALQQVLRYWLELVSPDWSSQGEVSPLFFVILGWGRSRLENQIKGGKAAPGG